MAFPSFPIFSPAWRQGAGEHADEQSRAFTAALRSFDERLAYLRRHPAAPGSFWPRVVAALGVDVGVNEALRLVVELELVAPDAGYALWTRKADPWALLTTDARSWRVRPAEYAARWIRASVERRDALFATELDEGQHTVWQAALDAHRKGLPPCGEGVVRVLESRLRGDTPPPPSVLGVSLASDYGVAWKTWLEACLDEAEAREHALADASAEERRLFSHPLPRFG